MASMDNFIVKHKMHKAIAPKFTRVKLCTFNVILIVIFMASLL